MTLLQTSDSCMFSGKEGRGGGGGRGGCLVVDGREEREGGGDGERRGGGVMEGEREGGKGDGDRRDKDSNRANSSVMIPATQRRVRQQRCGCH